jgi:hypothetical protein
MQTSVIAAIVAVYFLLALLWVVAMGRVAAGDRRFVVHVVGPQGLLGAVLALVAVTVFETQPLLGLIEAAFSFVYVVVGLRLVLQAYRAVKAAAPGLGRLDAIVTPFADHAATIRRLMLIGGLLALVALVVSAMSSAGS